MRVVVDASVVVKWVFPDPKVEPESDRALALLEAVRAERVQAIQPVHWLAEAAGALTRLDPRSASWTVGLLYALELPTQDDLGVLERAVELAARLRHHLFDTLYHAVAFEADATLVSADDRYCRKATGIGRLVRLAELDSLWREV